MTDFFQPTKELRRRKRKDTLIRILLLLCVLSSIYPLCSVLYMVIKNGYNSLNLSLFLKLPSSVGEGGGGLLQSILGSFFVVLYASLIGIFFGIGTGIYLSEYGGGKFAKTIDFVLDVLSSVPSIVLGLFVYSILVVPMKTHSLLAGSLSLSLIMAPYIARSTREILFLVSRSVKEAGLALGIPRWKVIVFIIFKGVLRGVSTGIILSIARASGETAPLLFTSLNNRFLSFSLDKPVSTLPVQIYTYAMSPYDEWHRLAWGGAFILVFCIFMLNLFTKYLTKHQHGV